MCTEIFDSESKIIFNDNVYHVKLYNENDDYFDDRTAYIKDDYFYIVRKDEDYVADGNNEPGIYYNPTTRNHILVEVPEELHDKYTFDGKVGTINPEKIIEMINNNEVVIINYPDSDKSSIPEITENDDILKRLMKQIINDKHINIDMCKDRFPDKNALFNFKQVIKGDGKLSILLFDRGIEAFNLKYKIIVEEAEPNKLIVGMPIKESIIASSDDEYTVN